MTKENQTQPVSGEMTDEAQRIGAMMANMLFNLAQKCGETISGDDCAMFDKLRKQWDSVPLSRAQDAQAVRNAALEEAVIIEAVREVVERDGYDVQDEHQAGLVEAVAVATVRALQSAPAQPVERPDAVELPKLPEPLASSYDERGILDGRYFTAAQMREYALAAIAANQPHRGNAQEPSDYADNETWCEAHRNFKSNGPFCPVCIMEEIDRLKPREGFATIPTEATEAMFRAFTDGFIAVNGDNRSEFSRAYSAMLAAAPQSDAQQSIEKEVAFGYTESVAVKNYEKGLADYLAITRHPNEYDNPMQVFISASMEQTK